MGSIKMLVFTGFKLADQSVQIGDQLVVGLAAQLQLGTALGTAADNTGVVDDVGVALHLDE